MRYPIIIKPYLSRLQLFLNISLLPGLCVLFGGCERNIEYGGKLPERKMVLFSFIEPDSMIRLQLGSTYYFSETGTSSLEEVSGEVYVNGDQAGIVELDLQSGYFSKVCPRPGDHVKIVVRAKGLNEVSGEILLPEKKVEVEVDTTQVGPEDKICQLFYNIRIKDLEKERHYYRLLVKTIQYQEVNGICSGSWSHYTYNMENDPLLTGGNNSWFDDSEVNIYRIFNNESFEGKGYTMRVSATAWNTYEYEYVMEGEVIRQREVMKQEVRLARIDEGSYLYLKSLMLVDRGQGIIEPVQVYSNVTGGIGVVGYVYYSTVEFEMPVVFDSRMYTNGKKNNN